MMNQTHNIFNEKTKKQLTSVLVIALFMAGLYLRVYFYLINRSLWVDEAKLALNLVNRTFFGLLKPLDLDQGAPIFFLFLQKAVSILLGNSDYTFRLVPLFAGLGSIPLMYAVSKQYGRQLAVFISLGLFTLSPRLIYFSSELKQYSTDVLITLVLLLCVPNCLEGKTKPRALTILGLTGSLAIWFSHSSLFIFAGIFLALALIFVIQKDSRGLFLLVPIGIAWAISFGIIYFINLRYLESNQYLIDYWKSGFAPLAFWNDPGWYYQAAINMLRDPAALPANIITLGMLILGALSLAVRRYQLMLVLSFPFLLILTASAFNKYPFSGRLILFLIPLILLLLAEGIEQTWVTLLKVNRPFAWLASAALIIYFLYTPMTLAYKNVQSPPLGEDIKPAMAYLSENRIGTDIVYVYYSSRPPFEFYESLYKFERNEYVVGIKSRNDPDQYIGDIEKVRGNQRVWFIFSHNCTWCVVNEQDFFLEHLNQVGQKKDEFITNGASVYLYDLR